MTDKEYGVIEEKQIQPKFPVRTLLRVPHKQGSLIVSRNAFGPNYFKDNIAEMQKSYCYPNTREVISFRKPTTAESISAAAYNFENFAKPEIFDPRWFQAGYMVRTQEGVFVNPLGSKGVPITDEKTLKSLLKSDRKVNGIYLLDNDMGFAPYDSFTRGVQDCDGFAQGGLARVLEHTPEKEAKQFKAIASPKLYKFGVNVWGFEEVKEPVLRVVCLGSYRNLGGGRLNVDGSWSGYYGYAFGVLNKDAEGVALEKMETKK